MTVSVPRPPKGLQGRGARLWRSLHEVLEFSPAESVIVLEACRVVNRIDALDEAIAENGTMVSGSAGQLVVNPAIGEQRQQQAGLARLLTQLQLDVAADGGVATVTAISAAAKRAAEARWSRSKGVRGA